MDKYQEHLDSQPDDSRWDGFCRGDAGRPDHEPGFLTFSQANAQAKALALKGRRVSVIRIADGCFEVCER
jgi:hypothetical protein